MDRQTIEFYNAHARETAVHYAESKSGVTLCFPVAFPPGARILGPGCGSGRDLDASRHPGGHVGHQPKRPIQVELRKIFRPQYRLQLRLDLLPQCGQTFC
jgi:hypothetical protein